jgi:hypothetical protein
LTSDRPDTIRNIVASLVGEGDDDSEDSLVDENDPVQPLQQPEVDDYYDPNWEPEPIDAGPGIFGFCFIWVKAFTECRFQSEQTQRHH